MLSLDDPKTEMEKGQVEILVNLENKVNFIRSIFYKSLTKYHKLKLNWVEIGLRPTEK